MRKHLPFAIFIIIMGLILALMRFYVNTKQEQFSSSQLEDLKSIMLKNCPSESGITIGVMHSKNSNSIIVSCNINNWGKQIETTNGIAESLLNKLNE